MHYDGRLTPLSMRGLVFALLLITHRWSDPRSGDMRPALILANAASVADVKSSPIEELSKFETYGPTITLTLRDPIISSRGNTRKMPTSMYKSKALVSDARPMSIDSSFEGLAAKLAARFHISSTSSNSVDTSKIPASDGYMVDGGNVVLGPPSVSRHDQSARQFFPLFDRSGSVMRLSECVQNLQPELAYEIRSRASPIIYNDEIKIFDTRPFPSSLPWLNAISCGLKWRPFPTYKAGEGYGHKLMSVPHFFQCGASICLPRVSKIFTPWKPDAGTDNSDDKTMKRRNLDLDLAYMSNGGRVELLLGKSSPSIQPQNPDKTNISRHNNHILACFAPGWRNGRHDKIDSRSSLVSSLEYLRGSIRAPLPAFLHKKCMKGMSVSPSYDFINEKARLIVSGDVGSSGQTSAVLRLDSDDSTLTLVRRLDHRKVIAPTISLQTGKIVYDWYIGLDNKTSLNGFFSKSSIRAHVDPTNGVRVVWTDNIPGKTGRVTEGSCWISEVNVPLGITAPGSRIGNIRVGRRWVL